MPNIAPGLIGDTVSPAAFRVFLGSPPLLAVERRLLRHMHVTVGSWFVTRRRIREQANEYIELNGSEPDTDAMLRHCHIFFVRRQLFNEVLEKQIAFLEAGKPPREADPDVLACLGEISNSLTPRLNYERRRLEAAKRACADTPHRRELQAAEPLDKWDTLCMMRCLEQDMFPNQGAGGDSEGQARAFLPLPAVQEAAERLARHIVRVGASLSVDGSVLPPPAAAGSSSSNWFSPKDEKFGAKSFVLGDYNKVGLQAQRLRPSDATALLRFSGERMLTSHLQAAAEMKRDPNGFLFRRALWGNVFRRFATNPAFLAHNVAQYWAAAPSSSDSNSANKTQSSSSSPSPPTGGDVTVQHKNPAFLKMPIDLAATVCDHQRLVCPATKLRTQYLYTHHDHAKQLWRSDLVYPSLRMLSATGAQCAEDMLASVLVDGFFAEQELESAGGAAASGTVSLLADDKLRRIISFVNETAAARSRSLDALLQRASAAARTAIVPPLTEDEINWTPEVKTQTTAAAGQDGAGGEENDDEDVVVMEEGVPENQPIPGEKLQ